MSSDQLSAEFTAVFTAAATKELKEKRALRVALDKKTAALDKRIAQLETLLGGGGSAASQVSPKKPKMPPDLKGLDTGEACVWLMRPRGDGARMTSREIADGLAAVGYKRTTNQITAALNHRLKSTKTNDIKRDGLHWIYISEASAKPEPSPMIKMLRQQADIVDAINER